MGGGFANSLFCGKKEIKPNISGVRESQRPMIIDPRKIIINRRDMQSRSDGLTSACLLLAFWGLMLHLARPLAAFTGWSAAVGDQPAFLPGLLVRYLPLMAGLSLSLVVWAGYNRLRFGGARDHRRAEPPALTLREISSAAPFGEKEVRSIRQAQVSFFFFDDKGEVIAVKCRTADSDTDHTLARAVALAPRAAGLSWTELSETPRISGSGRSAPGRGDIGARAAQPGLGLAVVSSSASERSQAPRISAAPLARPLRPVVAEGRLVARPLRPVLPGMEGLLISRPRNTPAATEGAVFQPLSIAAAMGGKHYSGEVSPEL